MKHKSGTLTNLELSLFNALAVETLLDAMLSGGGRLKQGRGGSFMASRITGRAGYAKTTSYHYKLLNKLVEYGYVLKSTMGRQTRYSLGVWGLRWLNLYEAASNLALEVARDENIKANAALHRAQQLREMFPPDADDSEHQNLDEIPF